MNLHGRTRVPVQDLVPLNLLDGSKFWIHKNFFFAIYNIEYKLKNIFSSSSLSIAEGVIGVKLAAGGDDDTGAMRRQLQKESAKTPNGAAFRWAVGAAPNGFLELQLQSLPAPAAVVNGKPMLRNVSIFYRTKIKNLKYRKTAPSTLSKLLKNQKIYNFFSFSM